MTEDDPGRLRTAAVVDDLLGEWADGEPDWENTTVPKYLEALVEVLRGIHRSYEFRGQPYPDDPWKVVADALRGATSYE